jgi:hypothetical protein
MILLFVDCPFLVDCTFFGAFHVSFKQPAPQPGAPHPSWIAPSWVHSTSLQTTSPSTRCSALLVDCTFLGAFYVSFKQPAPQPGAQRTPRGLHLPRCIPRLFQTTNQVQRTGSIYISSVIESPLRTNTFPHQDGCLWSAFTVSY